jgi:2-furoyl-CoA dehydrogenase FAD binding subunit
VKPARFDYVRAGALTEVHEVLAAERGDARILAGGQTLLPMLSMRLARPKVVVDIMQLQELGRFGVEHETIRIGAAVRQVQLQTMFELDKIQPLLALVLPWVGHAQTRSRGTVCGSIAHADPSAEIPLALVALGGEIELSARRRRRRVPAAEFFTGLMATACADDELIEAVVVPCARAGHGYAFREFARRHGDFAIVACAAVVNDGSVRLAVGGVADRPVVREFQGLDGRGLDEAIEALAWELEARDDLHATASYRRNLVRALGRDVIEEARRCRV